MNVRALRIAATTAFQRAASDRAAFVVSTGFYAAVVAMVGSLWRAAADAHHGAIVGYTAAALFWYIAASESATIAINIRLIEDIGNDIADGSVAVEMLRPASVVAQRIAIEIGRATPRLLCCIAAGVVLSLLVVGAPPDLAAASLAIPSLFLAIACNIAGQHVFAGVAFWIRDARSTWFLYQKFVFIMGGMLLPLEVLPSGLATAGRILPMSAMAYAPARLASGHNEPQLLLIQAVWLVVLTLGAAATFRAGERRLQVVGG